MDRGYHRKEYPCDSTEANVCDFMRKIDMGYPCGSPRQNQGNTARVLKTIKASATYNNWQMLLPLTKTIQICV